MTSPGAAPSQLLYVVVPHPDDEFSAWALLEASPDSYPVFVLCTQGERTGMADGRGCQPELGEWVPPPQPWGEPGSTTVRLQRLASFAAFLDAMLPDAAGPAPVAELTDGPSPFTVQVGRRSARVVFDGGDGRLTPQFVTAALQRTRALRETHLPALREHAAVGAAYFNSLPGSVRYTHPDHRAVHEALWHVDQGLPGPQWCRTATVDPDVARTEHVSPQTYRAAMAIAGDGRRTGAFQVFYGWLGGGRGWPAGETDATALFSRRQSFWRRSPNPPVQDRPDRAAVGWQP